MFLIGSQNTEKGHISCPTFCEKKYVYNMSTKPYAQRAVKITTITYNQILIPQANSSSKSTLVSHLSPLV